MTIGKKIKEIRLSYGLTQKKLAEKSGLAEITIRQYENEKRKPQIDALVKIANALDVVVTVFLDEPVEGDDLDELMTKQMVSAIGISKKLADTLEDNEIDMLYLYRKLNDTGKRESIKRLIELTKIPEYKKDKE